MIYFKYIQPSDITLVHQEHMVLIDDVCVSGSQLCDKLSDIAVFLNQKIVHCVIPLYTEVCKESLCDENTGKTRFYYGEKMPLFRSLQTP